MVILKSKSLPNITKVVVTVCYRSKMFAYQGFDIAFFIMNRSSISAIYFVVIALEGLLQVSIIILTTAGFKFIFHHLNINIFFLSFGIFDPNTFSIDIVYWLSLCNWASEIFFKLTFDEQNQSNRAVISLNKFISITLNKHVLYLVLYYAKWRNVVYEWEV